MTITPILFQKHGGDVVLVDTNIANRIIALFNSLQELKVSVTVTSASDGTTNTYDGVINLSEKQAVVSVAITVP